MAVAFDNLTLSQRVYEHLRDEILADHLLPGTELSEVALSKELAISRGPIREAMGRLAAEGLITMRPRRRAEVRSLTPQELIDAYQVREALEVMAVRLLIRRVTEAELARLEELIDQMAAHSAEGAVREFFTASVSFHELLCELSGNPKLQEVHHRLEGEIGRFQNRTLALRGSMDDSLAELARLEELIDQMAAHSAEGAVREFFTANVSFHELLCELSGNPKLQEVHHRLEGEIGRFQNRTLALRGSMDYSLTEHRAILAAVRLRDADRAATLIAEHIRVPSERLQATLRDSAASDPSAPGPSAPGASGPRPSAPGPRSGSRRR